MALDCGTVRQRRFTSSFRLFSLAEKWPTLFCTLDLLPKHTFPVASSLAQPQTASSALICCNPADSQPQVQAGDLRTTGPRCAGALSQVTLSWPLCLWRKVPRKPQSFLSSSSPVSTTPPRRSPGTSPGRADILTIVGGGRIYEGRLFLQRRIAPLPWIREILLHLPHTHHQPLSDSRTY